MSTPTRAQAGSRLGRFLARTLENTKKHARRWKFCSWCGSPLVLRVANADDPSDAPRRGCSSCDFVLYQNPIPVAAAVVELEDHDGQICLVQNKGWPSDWWGLVTGYMEMCETPEEACLREVKEELGLTDTKIISPIGIYSMHEKNEVLLAYHVAARGPVRINEYELNGYKLVPKSDLKAWPFGTGLAVRDFLKSLRQDDASPLITKSSL